MGTFGTIESNRGDEALGVIEETKEDLINLQLQIYGQHAKGSEISFGNTNFHSSGDDKITAQNMVSYGKKMTIGEIRAPSKQQEKQETGVIGTKFIWADTLFQHMENNTEINEPEVKEKYEELKEIKETFFEILNTECRKVNYDSDASNEETDLFFLERSIALTNMKHMKEGECTYLRLETTTVDDKTTYTIVSTSEERNHYNTIDSWEDIPEQNPENNATTGILSRIIVKGLESGDLENGIIQLSEELILNDPREEFKEKSKELQEKINQQGYLSLDDLGDYKQEVIDHVTYHLKDKLKTSINEDTLIQNKSKNKGKFTMDFLRERVNENAELHRNLTLYFDFINLTSGKNINYSENPELLVNQFNTFLYATYSSLDLESVDFSMLSEYAQHDLGLRKRRIERFKRWNSEINSRRINVQTSEKQDTSYTGNKKVSDIQDASGTQIIEQAKIGEQLVKYDDTHIDDDVSNEKKVQFRKEQLPIVRQNFIDKHNEIKDFIILEKFKKIYDPENNTINFSLDEGFDQSLDDKENLRLRLGFGENVDIDRIYGILMSFPDEMENMVKELSEDYVSEQEQANNDKRINTAGFILDNIKSLFEGFTYDEKYPVTLDTHKDMLIIKGSIKGPEVEGSGNTGTKTKICYDLKSGILYMNSFVKESYIPPVITIGERWNKSEDYPEADTEIGSIGSFDMILSYNDTVDEDEIDKNEDDYQDNISTSPNNIPGPKNFMYSRSNMMQDNNGLVGEGIEGRRRREQNMQSIPVVPPRPGQYPIPGRFPRPNIQVPINSYGSDYIQKNLKLKNEINTAIDLIGKEVKEYSKIQSKRNDVIINFLKTFNIIRDGESIKNMQFHEGSNLYSILRIIQNSDYNQLDSFSAFMTAISKCSGLQRGRNTLPEQQRNKCYKEIMDADIYNKNSARSCLKESLMNFKSETDNLSDPHNLNFDYKRNLGMAQLIINNIIDNSNSNNSSSANISKSRFDVIKIKDFLTSLNTGEQMEFNNGSNENFAEKDPDEELDEKLNLYNI